MKEVLELINSNSGAIAVMSIAIALDIITGIIKAVMEHDLKSSAFKSGLLKKTYDYILVIVGFCLDYMLKVDYVSKACLYSLIAMEFYSVIENLREYVPIPTSLANALNVLQKQESDTGETTEDVLDTNETDTPCDLDDKEED